jgi:hypothetical protein
MPTRMTHPENGAMHAYDSGEIARLEKLGWSVEKPAEVKEPVVAQVVVEVVAERKKPGPKPKAK